jgi:uncharacterized protein (TIGR03435 family)
LERVPVIDATGLSGRYDFTLTLDLYAGGERPTSDEILADRRAVLQREAGLTLEARKANVDVLVIDHINRVPASN